MIEVKNITKKFKHNLVLDDISFNVKDGECLGLLGSNGSGKTTLLEIIIGQSKPTSGEVIIDNQLNSYQNIGIQFQEGAWPKGVTPKSIISYFKRKTKILNDPEIVELIYIFEIENFIKQDLNTLSGGQKQRLNTLLAVLNNPQYICLDEMITGLDLKMQLKLMDFFIKLKNKMKTMIIISHIPEEIEQICDSLLILSGGKIFYQNTITKVVDEFGSVRNLMINFYEGRLISNAKQN